MAKLFMRWFRRNFSDPQAVILMVILLGGFLTVYTLSEILAPVFVAIVLAYLLEWVVDALERKNVKRYYSVVLVFSGFCGVFLLLTFGVIPLIWQQLENLVAEVPNMTEKAQAALQSLSQKYPGVLSEERLSELYTNIAKKVGDQGELVVKASVTSLVNIAAILVYLILVPLLIFFFMKDKRVIIDWGLRWLPRERQLANKVWDEVNLQIGNYIRGKVMEIFIVGAASFAVFSFMGLNYALLLGVLVGFSVLIPYIGAAVVTIPVAIIAYFQWGFESQFVYLMIAYFIIQALDGNVLVPILFSEAVNLHPVAIIIAVLFFGGIWGFWGVFFAIPLATLVKAVINGWDDVKKGSDEDEGEPCQ
ncbi:AI-2E family transporter [Pleionea sp. CnH1-48]|uniref:AI-2E family transporter n=1 Tax=Pleionea sp. CnH1-48 TaxID=2954494 RepID=UPI002096DBA7|nr:AI-2E family transporter [Pleionea sp. CnH1-48]MCO7223002.1 AI-2E family transporter [Pleionea sp. CnH1-48]